MFYLEKCIRFISQSFLFIFRSARQFPFPVYFQSWSLFAKYLLYIRSYAKNRKCKDFVIFLHLKLCIFSFSHFQFFHFMLLFSCFFIYFLLFLQYLVLSIILTIIAWQVKGLLFQSPQQQNCVRRTGVFSP